ncbi:hypothetical protein PHYBLDRAFT_138741 [Phycomyces blakesleeanus NRRL 1555(-)]|uniref:Uncharacterized protein n=1 Tax=Phycomyces blakesleeanus (strain ATCC 8743b / DSM 1359 / FGSC 10004 / NBRC 33097 / NRRL 1555) TaxID=763407 RepID=A0A163BF46_PHYB8|nr:hypothetical protein PHYBLDRAFT_138741 [Phycomyces blakesleeanus NRRL 1555(-)]OAD81201.1 hypothetical protein PHYBLDRAFT_138741 [Phycomyces blakesleeanus NRRL 1555(-)]|eukprot:XP_018299241.1 hypothetical protein PHYBLDRAFT_138741 [Phycomyces blakesleeanus NRRL 1555(-)]
MEILSKQHNPLTARASAQSETASGSNGLDIDVSSSSSAEETSRKAQKGKEKASTSEREQWDMAREIALMQLIYNCCPFANAHAKGVRAKKNLLFKKLNLVVNKDNERSLPVTANESASLLKQQLDILQQQQHTNNLVLEELKKTSWSNAVLAKSNQEIADSNKVITKSNSALAKSLSTKAEIESAIVESYKNNK